MISPKTLIFPQIAGLGVRVIADFDSTEDESALLGEMERSVIRTWACVGSRDESLLRTTPFSRSASIVVYMDCPSISSAAESEAIITEPLFGGKSGKTGLWSSQPAGLAKGHGNHLSVTGLAG